MTTRYLHVVLCLCFSLPVRAQTSSQQVTVDAYLSLSFPGRPSRYDAKDVTVFYTTSNHTTYKMFKRAKYFQDSSDQRHGEFMEKWARSIMAGQEYDGLSKKATDSVIGGATGRFIEMGRPDQRKPYFVFLFLTVRGSNMYLLECPSSRPEADALKDARNFFGGVVFH